MFKLGIFLAVLASSAVVSSGTPLLRVSQYVNVEQVDGGDGNGDDHDHLSEESFIPPSPSPQEKTCIRNCRQGGDTRAFCRSECTGNERSKGPGLHHTTPPPPQASREHLFCVSDCMQGGKSRTTCEQQCKNVPEDYIKGGSADEHDDDGAKETVVEDLISPGARIQRCIQMCMKDGTSKTACEQKCKNPGDYTEGGSADEHGDNSAKETGLEDLITPGERIRRCRQRCRNDGGSNCQKKCSGEGSDSVGPGLHHSSQPSPTPPRRAHLLCIADCTRGGKSREDCMDECPLPLEDSMIVA